MNSLLAYQWLPVDPICIWAQIFWRNQGYHKLMRNLKGHKHLANDNCMVVFTEIEKVQAFVQPLHCSRNICCLWRLKIWRTCSFATTEICFKPEREYSISSTFVHFCKLFADFWFRYRGLEIIEKHKRLDSCNVAFKILSTPRIFELYWLLTLFGWSTSTTICRRCRSRLVMNLRVLNVTTPSDCKKMEDK